MAVEMAVHLSRPGATRRWRLLRAWVLRKGKWRCAKCDCGLYLEVDHIVPLVDGGDMWAERNLQLLCRACHREKHGQPIVSQDVIDWEHFHGV